MNWMNWMGEVLAGRLLPVASRGSRRVGGHGSRRRRSAAARMLKRVAVSALLVTAAACLSEPAAPEPPAVYETARFRLEDYSVAPQALIDSIGERLETELDRVLVLLPEFGAPDTTWTFTLLEGQGMPFVRGSERRLVQSREDLALDYLPHQLTHLLTDYAGRPFLEEGLAVWVTEELLPGNRTVHPYRGQSPHAWVSLFQGAGSQVPIAVVWDVVNLGYNYDGSTADASAWQFFLEAGSFTRWVMDTYGRTAWFYVYGIDDLGGGLGVPEAELEAAWLAATRAAHPTPLSCEEALATKGPLGIREAYWCARARGE